MVYNKDKPLQRYFIFIADPPSWKVNQDHFIH